MSFDNFTYTGEFTLDAPARFGSGSLHFTSVPTGEPLTLKGEGNVPTFAALEGGNLSTHAMTVECWVMLDPANAGYFQPIVAMYESGGLLVWDGPNGQLVADGGMVAAPPLAGSFTLADGNWHHIAIVYDGQGSVSLYADGSRLSAGSASTSTLGGLNMHICAWWGSGARFRGYVDDLHVSRAARYSGATYATPTTGAIPDGDSVALYRFDGDLTNAVDGAQPEPSSPTITTSALPDMHVGSSVSFNLSATGDAPIEWDVTDGALPQGLSLSSSGLITGSPSSPAAYSVTIRASNAYGEDARVYSGTVVPASSISLDSPLIKWNPTSWVRTAGHARTSDVAASFHMLTDASTISITFGSANPAATVAYRVNRQSWVSQPLSSTALTISPAGDYAYTRNYIEVMLDGVNDPFYSNAALDITAITGSPGSHLYETPESDRKFMFLGDSITVGNPVNEGGIYGVTQSWATYVAERLNAQLTIQGYANRAISVTTNQGVPRAPDSWLVNWANQPRSFENAPTTVILMMGGGYDSTATQGTVESGVDDMIQSIRATLPGAQIVFIGHTRTSSPAVAWIRDRVQTYSGNVHYVDTDGWAQSGDLLSDNIHHSGSFNIANFGPRVAERVREIVVAAEGGGEAPATGGIAGTWDGSAWIGGRSE